jgi:prepilin-type N-terminal cleavage/methylation domain-containing protein
MKQKAFSIRKYVRSRKGFTLIELIVAMAVMSVLLALYYSMFFAGGRTYEAMYNSYKEQNEARIAMSFITVKIRQNDYVKPPNIHAISIGEDTDPDRGWYMLIDDGDVYTADEYIYTLPDGEGRSLMTSSSNFDPDGTVIAENLSRLELSSSTIQGNVCIGIKILYNGGGSELEETVVLRAK